MLNQSAASIVDCIELVSKSQPTRKGSEILKYFNQLLRGMETNGNDNGEELSVLLNKLRNIEILDEESSQRLFNVMEDIYNESVL